MRSSDGLSTLLYNVAVQRCAAGQRASQKPRGIQDRLRRNVGSSIPQGHTSAHRAAYLGDPLSSNDRGKIRSVNQSRTAAGANAPVPTMHYLHLNWDHRTSRRFPRFVQHSRSQIGHVAEQQFRRTAGWLPAIDGPGFLRWLTRTEMSWSPVAYLRGAEPGVIRACDGGPTWLRNQQMSARRESGSVLRRPLMRRPLIRNGKVFAVRSDRDSDRGRGCSFPRCRTGFHRPEGSLPVS